MLYCAHSSCSQGIFSHGRGEYRSRTYGYSGGMSSLGKMVSVKTDIKFVILAPGGREDLFSDVAAGVLVWMFICLSH